MRTAVLCLCVWMAASVSAQTVSFPYTEGFDAGAAKRWQVVSGDWEFGDGFVRQASSESGCALTLAAKPDGPFYLAVRFRPESAFNGAGLLFAVPESGGKADAMLVSCTPQGRIVWGQLDEVGALRYFANAAFDNEEKEQELAIAVDPRKLAFSIFHNGELIALNVRTPVAAGMVGIQTSGGPHTITGFEIRPAIATELQGVQPPGPQSGMLDLIGDARGVIVLKREPEFLTLFNARGGDVARVDIGDVKGLEAERLDPVGLTWFDWPTRDGNPGVLVLAEGGAALYLFDSELRQLGEGPLARVAEMRGTGVAVGPQGHIFVSDAGIPGIRVLHAAGGELLTYGEKGTGGACDRPNPELAGKFAEPCAIAVNANGDIVVLDRGIGTYLVYRYDRQANRLNWVTNGPWLPAVDGVRFDELGRMLLTGPLEAYRPGGGLRVMLNGLSQRIFTGTALGGLSARVRACQGPGKKYYVADPDRDRILVLPAEFVEQLPRFEWSSKGGVKLTATTADGRSVSSVSNERPPRDGGRVLVRPGEPACETWPSPLPDEVVAYSLPPAPPRGKTYVIDMPVLVAVFAKAVNEDGTRAEIDPAGVIERLRRELEVDRLFYWRCSHGILNKQFEFMLIDDAEPKVEGGWIEPSLARTLVNVARQKQGLPAIGPDHSLIGIHPMPGFDPTFTDDPGTVYGGGLTVFAYSGYGLWNHGQGWLMAHEWGHQLDSYFEKSGFPDWWLNHPDGTVHVGRYGEHWDCNAFLCRRADRMNWLRLRYGTLRLVDDRDEDGFADADPTLPLDEKRFGSDPLEADSDLDGLGDLDEMAAGTFSSTDPLKRDTNANGATDGHDPYPQFAVKSAIPRWDEQVVERVMAGEAPESAFGKLGTVRAPWCDADVYAGYASQTLAVAFKLRKPVQQVFAAVDFNDDGWFVGQDQVYATVELGWPSDGSPGIRAARACEAALSVEGGGATLLLRIPVSPARPPLLPGSAVGMCVRIENGPGRAAFLLDPWQLLTLRCE